MKMEEVVPAPGELAIKDERGRTDLPGHGHSPAFRMGT